MMKGKLKLFSVAILIITAIGCKEKDTTDPIAILLNPMAGDTISTGTMVPVVLELEDDRELMQYTVVLKAKEEPLSGNVLPSFSYGDAVAVFGSSVTDTFEIDIPSDHAVGTYELEYSATDLAGNNSGTKFIDLYMENDLDGQNPQFNISTLSESGINDFNPQESISIHGTAQDNRELGGMRAEIKDLDNNLVEVREFQFQSAATSFTNSIPAPAQNGTYNLIITVADNVNNQVSKVYTIKVQ